MKLMRFPMFGTVSDGLMILSKYLKFNWAKSTECLHCAGDKEFSLITAGLFEHIPFFNSLMHDSNLRRDSSRSQGF